MMIICGSPMVGKIKDRSQGMRRGQGTHEEPLKAREPWVMNDPLRVMIA
jgi:hypothetical protein